jgi:hypothetical protein
MGFESPYLHRSSDRVIRNPDPRSTGARYSSKVPQRQSCAIPFSNSDMAAPSTRAAGMACCGAGHCDDLGPADRAERSFFASCDTLPHCRCMALLAPRRGDLRVALAACATGKAGVGVGGRSCERSPVLSCPAPSAFSARSGGSIARGSRCASMRSYAPVIPRAGAMNLPCLAWSSNNLDATEE